MPVNSSASFGVHHHDALLKAIKSADICVFFQTPDLIYRWVENLPAILAPKWRPLARDLDLFDAEQADAIETIKLQVLASGECQTTELHFDEGGKTIWYNFCIDCQRDSKGLITGLITTGVNVTVLRQREQVLKILLREVCHRTKNLLAIVQSIANQTARFSDSIESFMKKFQGRLQSISSSQDLVTHSNWTGTGFYSLVDSQCGSAICPEKDNFSVTGQDVYLLPNAALHIGLALHELLINSLSFGALSQNEGKVKITGSLQKDITAKKKGGDNFILLWQEFFDPAKPMTSEAISRFGSIVLEKIVPVALNAEASYAIDAEGAYYQLILPAEQFSSINI